MRRCFALFGRKRDQFLSRLHIGGAKMAGGAVASQMVLLLAMPLLTRFYDPSAFGDLAVFSSLYAILIGVSTLKYELTILLPKEPSVAEDLSAFTMATSLLVSCLLLMVAVGLRFLLQSQFPAHYLILPFVLVAGGLFSVGQQWCSRDKKFPLIGIALLVGAIVNVSIAFILAFWDLSETGLIAGFSCGLASSGAFIVMSRPSLGVVLWRRIRRLRWNLAKIYSHFPLHVLPGTLLIVASSQAIPIIMTHYFSSSAIGLYSIANRFVTLPALIVGGAVAEVIRSEYVTQLNAGEGCRKFLKKSLWILFVTLAPAYVLIWLFAPLVFSVVFGNEYLDSGYYAAILCPGAMGLVFSQSFYYVFIAANRTKLGAMFQFFSALIPVAAFVLGAEGGSLANALLWMSLANALVGGVFTAAAYAVGRDPGASLSLIDIIAAVSARLSNRG